MINKATRKKIANAIDQKISDILDDVMAGRVDDVLSHVDHESRKLFQMLAGECLMPYVWEGYGLGERDRTKNICESILGFLGVPLPVASDTYRDFGMLINESIENIANYIRLDVITGMECKIIQG